MTPKRILLWYRNDLRVHDHEPFPEVFTQFRKKVESHCTVNSLFPSPQNLPNLSEIELGELPTIQDLGLDSP